MIRKRIFALLSATLLIVGCAGNQSMQRAALEVQRGNLDTAISYYQEILLEDPGNVDAKIRLTHLKVEASQVHEQQGRALREEGDFESSMLELQLAVLLDPGNVVALEILGRTPDTLRDRGDRHRHCRRPGPARRRVARGRDNPAPGAQ